MNRNKCEGELSADGFCPKCNALPLPRSPGSEFREWAAYECYVRDTVKAGYMPVRWGVLRSDLKAKWITFADELVAAWTADEAEAKARRERHDIPNTEVPDRPGSGQ